ncbi:hypothetical protein F5887DRAFT_1288455 [Amanita rubescens]|nr:hypothetical protein F5887DRAFT_1288455 [Amanita rubescens]
MSSIVSEASFIRLFTKAFLLGTYLISFFVCLRWLLFSDDGRSLRKRVDHPMIITTFLLFTFALTDFGLYVYLTLSQSDHTWANDTIGFVEVSTSITFDAVLIYRCWLIYGKSWRIAVFPLFLWTYKVSCLFMLTYWSCPDPSPKLFCSDIRMPFFASSVSVNVYTTSAVIWQISRSSLSWRRFRFTIRVIVESGLLCVVGDIATLFVLFLRDQVPFFLVTTIGFPLALLSHNLSLIRVASKRAEPEDDMPSSIGCSAIERNFPRLVDQATPRHEKVG